MDLFFYTKGIAKKPQGGKRGFTLIEMIVATSVFIISVLIIVGSLVSLNNASRKARAIRIATDNLSAAIDSISRNVRMGTTFHCGCGGVGDPTFPTGVRDCPMLDNLGNGGARCLAYEGQSGTGGAGDQIVYRLSGGKIQRSTDSGVTYLDMTAPEIRVTDFKFFVQGIAKSEDQPVITMLMRGDTGVTPTTKTVFNLETTINPRTPNF